MCLWCRSCLCHPRELGIFSWDSGALFSKNTKDESRLAKVLWPIRRTRSSLFCLSLKKQQNEARERGVHAASPCNSPWLCEAKAMHCSVSLLKRREYRAPILFAEDRGRSRGSARATFRLNGA